MFATLRATRVFAFVVLLAIAFPSQAARDFYVVSDYDDTLKVSNVSGPRWDFVRRVFSDESFYAGMAMLYGVWHDTTELSESPLHIVSASPSQLRSKILEDLEEKGGFPPLRLSLRNWLRDRSTVSFKLAELRKHLTHTQPMILVGDDTEHDPEIYVSFAKEKRILATYIRFVTGKALGAGQLSFLTAFDIAASEYVAGRFTASEAVIVADAVLRSKDRDIVAPFVVCRNLQSACLAEPLTGTLRLACEKVQSRVSEICTRRAR